jgi:hypothetical protein
MNGGEKKASATLGKVAPQSGRIRQRKFKMLANGAKPSPSFDGDGPAKSVEKETNANPQSEFTNGGSVVDHG